MDLRARVVYSPKLKEHWDQRVRQLPGAIVRILPETMAQTPIGARIDVIPEDLRFEEPQSILLRFLELDEFTEKALGKVSKNI